MAQTPPPPPNKKTTKGTPPLEITASSNLNKSNEGDLVPMNFKVTKEFKKEFRSEAMELEITMTDLLKKMFEQYKSNK